jgi:hypothetical protein
MTASRRFAVAGEPSGPFHALRRQLSFVGPKGPRAMTIRKVIVLGCVLAAIAITLKIKLETPQGAQPLPRALVTTHWQQLRGDLALP